MLDATQTLIEVPQGTEQFGAAVTRKGVNSHRVKETTRNTTQQSLFTLLAAKFPRGTIHHNGPSWNESQYFGQSTRARDYHQLPLNRDTKCQVGPAMVARTQACLIARSCQDQKHKSNASGTEVPKSREQCHEDNSGREVREVHNGEDDELTRTTSVSSTGKSSNPIQARPIAIYS